MAIEIYAALPQHLDVQDWRKLQGIQREGFTELLGGRHSQEEIDNLTNWNDFESFHASHLDPNSEVGNRFNANQSFSSPRVTVAVDGNDIVGFGYSAINVSGSTMERAIKRMGVAKKYHWLREFAVHPEYQRRGIATRMAGKLIDCWSECQPVTAYIWPLEIPFLFTSLQKRGFQPTGVQMAHIYGEDTAPVMQTRMLKPGIPREYRVLSFLVKHLYPSE